MAYIGTPPINPANGGTGVINANTSTITLAGPLVTSGANSLTITTTGPTSVTFPTSGTLSTSTGTVTSVSGTTNQVAVATGTTTPVISLVGPYTPATYTAHGVLVGEGTSSIAALAAGSAGQVLQSGGASADPTYSTATFPSTATGTGKILIADGTNWVASTPTYPNTSGTAGKVVISNGTNNVYSTPTFPNASATSGKFIQSDGTNWIASTPTLPTTAGTSGNVITSDGTNFVSTSPSTAGASWFKITTSTVSGSSGITITSGITSTYNNYALMYNNVTVAGALNLLVQISTDGGSSYISTSYQSGLNAAAYNSTTWANNSFTTGLIVDAFGATTVNANGILYLFNMTRGSGYVASYSTQTKFNSSTTPFIQINGGAYTVASQTVNAIQITPSTSTFSGTFTLYGLKE